MIMKPYWTIERVHLMSPEEARCWLVQNYRAQAHSDRHSDASSFRSWTIQSKNTVAWKKAFSQILDEEWTRQPLPDGVAQALSIDQAQLSRALTELEARFIEQTQHALSGRENARKVEAEIKAALQCREHERSDEQQRLASMDRALWYLEPEEFRLWLRDPRNYGLSKPATGTSSAPSTAPPQQRPGQSGRLIRVIVIGAVVLLGLYLIMK